MRKLWHYKVLIETYWNVKNSIGWPAYFPYSCINRNILECKEVTTQQLDITRTVLIETYWNVKVVADGKTLTLRLRINRNILECKVLSTKLSVVPALSY